MFQVLEASANALSYRQIYPLKRQVLTLLQQALDHRKRSVRLAASRCANRWHTLSAK